MYVYLDVVRGVENGNKSGIGVWLYYVIDLVGGCIILLEGIVSLIYGYGI